MKRCSKCNCYKIFSAYYKCKRDGYQSYCKSCKKLAKKEDGSDKKYYMKTRQLKPKRSNVYKGREKEYKKSWYLENKDFIKLKSRLNYLSTNKGKKLLEKERFLKEGKRRCKACTKIKPLEEFFKEARNSKFKVMAKCKICERKRLKFVVSTRNAKKIKATPKWANLSKIKEIYKNCPEGYHVDHILPLQGKFVSGLHVETNLQYLTVFENLSKGNRI